MAVSRDDCRLSVHLSRLSQELLPLLEQGELSRVPELHLMFPTGRFDCTMHNRESSGEMDSQFTHRLEKAHFGKKLLPRTFGRTEENVS